MTNAAQKEIHQGIVPESAIQSAVQTVLDFIKDDSIDLLIRTGAAHYLFGYIHRSITEMAGCHGLSAAFC